MNKKKIYLIISVLCILFVFIFILIIPVRVMKVEEKEKIFKIPKIERKSDINIIKKETIWNVKWYVYDNTSGYNKEIGKEKFPGTFKYYWDKDYIYENYIDWVRLEGEAYIYARRGGLYRFYLGADDGVRLLLNGNVVMSYQWSSGGSYRETYKDINLTKGKHKLELHYYEKYAEAGLMFNCSPELLYWEETLRTVVDTTIYYDSISIETDTIFKNVPLIKKILDIF